ncbi:MAG: purine-nucleoside phosphorylase [Haliscomenobacteraceae bacterium CHB4]|nr:Purine nucleoside phosphorylase 1 [Saprospiraceae bacterium]MCE7925120.1 purine-nucleoside phosphorylase [Haliscomenobacteraceae bacterium CHB4]
MPLYEEILEAVAFIRAQTGFRPRTGIILGTGLGNLTDDVEVEAEIAYRDIPHFAVSTVESHKGKLVFGALDGHPVVVMAGRFHYYEGWTMQQVTFPVRVLKYLGIERLIITNASGGVNPHLRAGDIVIVREHINLLPEHPLRGPNDERLGPRFPDMSQTYDADLRRKVLDIAKAHGVRAVEGVYSALQGPNLETPAEYGMLRRLGSDCTGMSSIPEVLVARHMDLPAMMLSLVTNVAYPPAVIRETSVEDVIAAASAAEPKLSLLVKELLKSL